MRRRMLCSRVRRCGEAVRLHSLGESLRRSAGLCLLITLAVFATYGSARALLILESGVGVDFRQAENGTTAPHDVDWSKSILQQNNSTYYEGMSVAQRLIFVEIDPLDPPEAPNDHTLTFSHQALKGGIHAYDFLTSWDQAVATADVIVPGQDLVSTVIVNAALGQPGACGPVFDPEVDYATCNALRTGSYMQLVDIPDTMGIVGGHLVDTRIAAYESAMGNRQLTIYGNAPITAAALTLIPLKSTLDVEAEYVLTWTSASTEILIEFAGHLAVGPDNAVGPGIGYGAGSGASAIGGGPYHVSLDQLDGQATGSMDNQIKGADVLIQPCPGGCDDGFDCTADSCDEVNDVCVHVPNDALCDDNNTCTDDVCDVSLGCVLTNNDANACDDGDTCTTDACTAGACVGTPVVCPDSGNGCTELACDPGGADENCDLEVAANEGGACGDPSDTDCDDPDTCVGGVCQDNPTPVGTTCPDDGNECTIDECDGAGSCTHTPVGDGTGCNDDGNECTSDVCSGGVCTHPSLVDGTSCADDGIGCTQDECVAGSCAHLPNHTVCDDSEDCTDDTCDPVNGDPITGCLFTPDDTNVCADGANCTDDACVGGTCVSTPVDCSHLDDACNVGVCNASTGACEAQPGNEGGACGDDGSECTNDVCQAGVCMHPALTDGTACTDDGIACTVDECTGGVCTHATNDTACDDSETCTDDTCDPVNGDPITGCLFTPDDTNTCTDGNLCTDDACQAGACVGTPVDCSHLDEVCSVGVCNQGTGLCEAQPNNEGGACPDDGNECTDDVCQAGACTHPALVDGTACTDDGNDCTSDACSAGVCAHPNLPDGTTCADEGVACTVDACVAGACTHTADDTLCDDARICTTDWCDALEGCKHDPVLGCCETDPDCDDDDACSTDVCNTADGTCSYTSAVDCSHLDDACNVGVCVPADGSCAAQPINEGGACPDDGNECTDDVCLAGVCTHPAVADATACTDDGITCTVDECIAGACSHTPDNSVCEDSESCTDDTCDPANGDPVTGCLFTADDTNTCADADLCTDDACQAGACVSTPVNCSHLDDACNVGVCNQATGACEAQPTNDGGSCPDDGNECTSDVCQAGVCTHTALADGTTCTDDGITCTVDECIAGACSHTPDNSVCDDSESCTDDTCDPPSGNPVTGCLYTPDETNTCTDGDLCTDDACDAGACVGTPVDCSHLDDPCNVGVCNQATGACEPQPTNEAGPCPDDGNECTDDVCLVGVCTHTALVDGTSCTADAVTCTVDECIAGTCSHTPDNSVCDDSESCTDDTCDPANGDPATGCLFTADDNNICDDGDLCAENACDNGSCISEPVNCSYLDDACNAGVCDQSTGDCAVEPGNEGGACDDDGNGCTDDICAAGACTHPPLGDGTPCPDDGIACTDDVCEAAACVHPPDDTNTCSDNDNCTADACVGGACVGTAVVCGDSGDPCTELACDPAGGEENCDVVVDANEGGPCDDGDACSIGERCLSGSCAGGMPVDCSYLDDFCNVGLCDPSTGNCSTETINDGGPCEDDGDECTHDRCFNGTCTHSDSGLCGACCLPDVGCVDLTSVTCQEQGGKPAGLGVPCGADNDGDGVDDLCDQCPGADDASFAPGCKGAIPTVSQWGLAILTLLLLVTGKICFGARRRVLG